MRHLSVGQIKVDATGEGSRGGVVIGRTSTGKPIYKHANKGQQKLHPDKLLTMQPARDTKKAGVESYRERIKAGAKIEPIRVIHVAETGKFKVLDGHHRLAAFKKEGHQKVPVEVTHTFNTSREANDFYSAVKWGR